MTPKHYIVSYCNNPSVLPFKTAVLVHLVVIAFTKISSHQIQQPEFLLQTTGESLEHGSQSHSIFYQSCPTVLLQTTGEFRVKIHQSAGYNVVFVSKAAWVKVWVGLQKLIQGEYQSSSGITNT